MIVLFNYDEDTLTMFLTVWMWWWLLSHSMISHSMTSHSMISHCTLEKLFTAKGAWTNYRYWIGISRPTYWYLIIMHTFTRMMTLWNYWSHFDYYDDTLTMMMMITCWLWCWHLDWLLWWHFFFDHDDDEILTMVILLWLWLWHFDVDGYI